MPHPANLWVGTEDEAIVDRFLIAVDAYRAAQGLGPHEFKNAGAAARQLLLDAPRALPRGDAFEDDEDVPPPPEVA